jgi:hypothetical protein
MFGKVPYIEEQAVIRQAARDIDYGVGVFRPELPLFFTIPVLPKALKLRLRDRAIMFLKRAKQKLTDMGV